MQTEDRRPEVYLVLERQGDWVQVRIPARPNGQTGWVRRTALGPIRNVSTRIIVDRKTATLRLTKRGRTIFKTRVGVGKRATPTPAGYFWVREKLRFREHPGVRLLRARHRGLREAERLAGRRCGRDPRHEPAAADPGSPVARLHPGAERRRWPACTG